MKSMTQVLLGGLVLAVSLLFLQAQEASTPADAAAEPTDAEIMLQAIMDATPPLPPSKLPDETKISGFFSAQHGEDWPPLPANIWGFDYWPLGDGYYLLNDLDFPYQELQAAAQAEAEAAALRNPNAMMAMSLAYNPTDDTRPYLTNLLATLETNDTVTVSFDIACVSNRFFQPCDIRMTTNLTAPLSEWTWLGIGYASNHYGFAGLPYDQAFFALTRPNPTMTVAWGNSFVGEGDVPWGLTNAVQVVGGAAHSLALLSDGTVAAWGWNNEGETDVPTNAVGVTMIAAGWFHSLALLTNGTVVTWGDNTWGQRNVPADATNLTVIAAQSHHNVGLREDSTVLVWGHDGNTGVTNVPAGLSNVVAIAAGYQHALAVKEDGTVAAWGGSLHGQCTVPAGVTNVYDVAAGPEHSVALRRDGTVICWGGNQHGEGDVPAGLSNVVAIAAGGDPVHEYSYYTLALKSDGTVAMWGEGEALDPVAGLNNVIAIGGGWHHALGVRSGPPTPVLVYSPRDQYQVAGGTVTFHSRGAGVYGVDYQWQYGGVDIAGETNAALALTNVQAANEGAYRVAVSNEFGGVVSQNAQFHLITPPVISLKSPATNPTVYYQSDTTLLSVLATAPGQDHGFPLNYQWQRNGTNLAGATGSAFLLTATNGTTDQYSVIVSNAAGSTNATWEVTINYGTLAYYLSTNTAAYTNGYTGSSNDMLVLSGWTQAVYTNENLGQLTNAVWSTNCWLKGVQGLSATSIGCVNGLPGGNELRTLVSPRHFLYATHTGFYDTNRPLAFLDTNNVIHWRTMMQFVELGFTDVAIGILNEELPASVGFLPVLPTHYTNYLPASASMPVQGIGMNQFMQVFGQPMTFENAYNIYWSVTNAAPFGLGTNWNVYLVHGDSSCPERLLINNQLVMVTANRDHTFGPNYSYHFDEINEAMHFLSTNNSVVTDYQLSPIPLTNWPSIR